MNGGCCGRDSTTLVFEANAETCDEQLLARFFQDRDERAFESLVRRHGPMVHGVCRRVLNDAHEAEDAFQATFLVLARRRSLKTPRLLSAWLYGVAYRVATKAKTRLARQERRQSNVEEASPPQVDLAMQLEWNELRAVLDQELSSLPAKQRVPLVLCYLEGRTHAEAAQQLGWPEGSMSWHLAQARESLRRGLMRRGISLPVGVLAALLLHKAAPGAVPVTLIEATVRMAAQPADAPSAADPVQGDDVASQLAEAVGKQAGTSQWTFSLLSALLLLLIMGGGITAASRSESILDATWGKGQWNLTNDSAASTPLGAVSPVASQQDLKTGLERPVDAEPPPPQCGSCCGGGLSE